MLVFVRGAAEMPSRAHNPRKPGAIPGAATNFEGDAMEQEHITQFFAYAHLPAHLQTVSEPFCALADKIMQLPRNPERTVALRKLLESKDAAVRAALAKPVG